MQQFKEILVFGEARFLDTVYGKKFVGTFKGDLEGTASAAIKARQDILGQSIDGTYIKNATARGNIVTFEKGNGSTFTITTQGGGGGGVEVIDELTSTDPNSALSANMGRVLDEKIMPLEDSATWVTY